MPFFVRQAGKICANKFLCSGSGKIGLLPGKFTKARVEAGKDHGAGGTDSVQKTGAAANLLAVLFQIECGLPKNCYVRHAGNVRSLNRNRAAVVVGAGRNEQNAYKKSCQNNKESENFIHDTISFCTH